MFCWVEKNDDGKRKYPLKLIDIHYLTSILIIDAKTFTFYNIKVDVKKKDVKNEV